MSLPPLAPLPFVSNVCFGVLSDAYAARTACCRRQSSAWFFNVNDHALFYKSDLGPFYERSSRWFLSHERHRFRGIGLAPILPFGRGLAAIKIVWNRHQRRIPSICMSSWILRARPPLLRVGRTRPNGYLTSPSRRLVTFLRCEKKCNL